MPGKFRLNALLISDYLVLINFIAFTGIIPSFALACLCLLEASGARLLHTSARVRADAVIERVKIERVAIQTFDDCSHALLEGGDAVTEAFLHRLFGDGIDLRVDLDHQHVLEVLHRLLDVLREVMVVLVDQAELGTEDLGFLLLADLCEGVAHDGDDHVEDDKHGDERASEEDRPEDDDVICVADEVPRDLEVAQRQPIRVDKRVAEAWHARIFRLFRVLVEDPEEDRLAHDDRREHGADRQGIVHDLDELTHEIGEVIEDSDAG